MKKSFLFIIAALTVQPTIFGMKRSVQQTLEQKNTKKAKTNIVEPGAMFYILKTGKVITLDPLAVALCETLSDIADYSQENYDKVFPGKEVGEIPFDLGLSTAEAEALFTMLNTLSESPDFYVDPLSGKRCYLNQRVDNITTAALDYYNLNSLESLITIINVCDFLQCSALLNACTNLLIQSHKKSILEGHINILDRFSNNSGAVPFLEKHLQRIQLSAKENKDISEYTLLDNVIRHGRVGFIFYFIANLENIKLTSLDGLKTFAKQFNKKFLQISSLNCANNFLELANLTPYNCFNYFPNLTDIDLRDNCLTSCDFNGFKHAAKIKVIDLSSNELCTLNESTFSKFSNLESLGLSNNKLVNLHPDLCNNFIKLEILNLSNNKLTIFDFHALQIMPKLKYLNLEGNNITEKNKRELREMEVEINKIRIQNGAPKLKIDLSSVESRSNDFDPTDDNMLLYF